MPFDPSKLSPIAPTAIATPTASSGGFDPSKLSPISSPDTSATPVAGQGNGGLFSQIGDIFNESYKRAENVTKAREVGRINPLTAASTGLIEGFRTGGDLLGLGLTKVIEAGKSILSKPLQEVKEGLPPGYQNNSFFDKLAPDTQKNIKRNIDDLSGLFMALPKDAMAKLDELKVTDPIRAQQIEDLVALPLAYLNYLGVKGVVAGTKIAFNELGGNNIVPALKKDILGPLKQNSVNKLAADYETWSGEMKTGVKNLNKTDARTAALNRAGTVGRPANEILANDGIVPETGLKKGITKFTTYDQANEYRKGLKPMVDAEGNMLKEVVQVTKPLSLADREAVAISNVRNNPFTAGNEQEIIDEIKKEFRLLGLNNPEGRFPSGQVDAFQAWKEKSKYGGVVKYNSTRPFQSDANYQITKSFQQGIEQTARVAGFEDLAQLNREIGDRLEAAKFLESLNGQTLKYGKIGRYFFMGIGSTLGKTPVGKILGAFGGDMVGKVLMDLSVAGPVKRLILNSIEKQGVEAYEATLSWIKKQGLERADWLNKADKLFLEASKTIRVPPSGTPSATDMAASTRIKTDQIEGTFTRPGYVRPVEPVDVVASQKAAGIYEPPNLLPAPGQTAPRPILVPPGGFKVKPTQADIDAAYGRKLASKRKMK